MIGEIATFILSWFNYVYYYIYYWINPLQINNYTCTQSLQEKYDDL